MLNPSQSDLYQRLQAFELDNPTDELGFTRHLMRNQGWTETYAQRVIAEYKKFVFLTVVAQHQIVPSDQVDQVWHTHILFTQSYWEEFCPKLLGKKLHHHPTRGGQAERAKFHSLYAQTIASYRDFFGEPPTDIWSPPDRRFGAELKMQRINLSENWVIPKHLPQVRIPKTPITAAMMVMMTIGCTQRVKVDGFEDTLSKLVHEHLCIILTLFSIAVGMGLRYWIQRPGHQPQKPELDLYQISYLAGGTMRTVDVAIAKLVQRGYLFPIVRHRTLGISKNLPDNAPEIEKQVMRRVGKHPELKRLRDAAKHDVSVQVSEGLDSNLDNLIEHYQTNLRDNPEFREEVSKTIQGRLSSRIIENYPINFLSSMMPFQTNLLRESLEREQLLMTGRSAYIAKNGVPFFFLSVILGFALICFCQWLVDNSGIIVPIKYRVNIPTEFVWNLGFNLCYIMGIIAFCCNVPSGRTRWGNRVLADIKKNHNVYNGILRCALYGYRSLSGGALDQLKQIYEKDDDEANAGACGC